MKLINAVLIAAGLGIAATAQAGHPTDYHQQFRAKVIAGHSYYSHPQRQQHYSRHDNKHYRHHPRGHAHGYYRQRRIYDHPHYHQPVQYYQRHVHTRHCDHRRPVDTRIKVFLGF